MKKMLGDDFSRAVWLGTKVSPIDLEIVGDVKLEVADDMPRLPIDGLDLENVDITGDVIIRNVNFTKGLNFFHCRVAGQIFILENVSVDGDYALPENLQEMVEDGRTVIIRNVSFTGLQQWSSQ
jgi:hypothetical protein